MPQIFQYNKVSSTQDIAFELIDNDCNQFSIIFADYQTKGRGQAGKSWSGNKDNSLMFSMVLKPLSHIALGLLPIRIGLVLSNLLQSYTDQKVWLKWPNDLIIADTKVAGILCEAKSRESSIYAVAGVGINLAEFEFNPNSAAEFPIGFLANFLSQSLMINHSLSFNFSSNLTSIRQLKEMLKTDISSILEKSLLNDNLLSYTEILEFNNKYIFYQKIITRNYLGNVITGKSIGINNHGHLLLELENSDVITIVSNL